VIRQKTDFPIQIIQSRGGFMIDTNSFMKVG